MHQDHDIVVLGAGISGLTAAHVLARSGREVLLIDRRPAPGGRIHTEYRDGFLVEHGPNSLVSPAPGAEALIDALGLADARIERGEAVRHRYLVRDGRAHALPLDPFGFFASGFFSLRGRLRLLGEPFIRPQAADETVAAFITRRFGRELLEYVFDPLVGGLYAGEAEQLSTAALFPHLKRLEREHGSIVRGVLAARRGGSKGFDPRCRKLFSFSRGMATLPARLMETLTGRVRFGTRVEGIEPLHEGYRLQLRQGDHLSRLRARSVVVALPAYAAARVLAPLSAETGSALAGIEHPPLAVVALGFRAADIAHPLDGLGVLAPKVERRNVLGLLFSSTLFAGRAPDGHVLLTAYVGGARQPELAQLPREALEALVLEEARDLLGVRGAPVFSSVRWWRHGLPQPGLGHERRVEALRALEAEWPGLFVTGNYISGVSTAACSDAARGTASRAQAFLAAQRSGTASVDGARQTSSLQA
jgi:oxygen-dependent protoporphyrinogen oxidase